jgi:hypothetical protein
MEVSLVSCILVKLNSGQDKNILLLHRAISGFDCLSACPGQTLSDMGGRPLSLLDNRALIADLV